MSISELVVAPPVFNSDSAGDYYNCYRSYVKTCDDWFRFHSRLAVSECLSSFDVGSGEVFRAQRGIGASVVVDDVVGSVSASPGFPSSVEEPQVVVKEQTDVSGGSSESDVRVSKSWGKHHDRNVSRRAKARETRRKLAAATCGVERASNTVDVGCRVGKFSSCSDEVQKQLKESHAARLIAENKAAAVRAEAYAKKCQLERDSRVAEKKVEIDRLSVDDKLQKISDIRFGSSPGFAETLVSNGLDSVPSLSSGTVSPDSSISVAEEMRLRNTVKTQADKISQMELMFDGMKKASAARFASEKSPEEVYGDSSVLALAARHNAAFEAIKPPSTVSLPLDAEDMLVY